MFSISNGLSITRIPLAFLLLIDNATIRITAILLAAFTDSIDGYFARKYNSVSKFGAVLDASTDKFFVYFACFLFLRENYLTGWQFFFMLSRDFALIIYALYMLILRKFSKIQLKSIRWGKVTTALQFLILLMLSLKITFPPIIFWCFILFGVMAFIELLQMSYSKTAS